MSRIKSSRLNTIILSGCQWWKVAKDMTCSMMTFILYWPSLWEIKWKNHSIVSICLNPGESIKVIIILSRINAGLIIWKGRPVINGKFAILTLSHPHLKSTLKQREDVEKLKHTQCNIIITLREIIIKYVYLSIRYWNIDMINIQYHTSEHANQI